MEPGAPTARPTGMRLLALAFAALLPLSLAACGSEDDGDDVASDPAPTSATATPTPTPTPTSSPTVGTYPAFEPTDYTFVLSVSCFCMAAGVPIQVTVVDSEVVGAVYGMDDTGRGGVKAGDPADHSFWMTINEIIDAANDTEADKVRVDWPAGQDYPTSVYVDGEKGMADDEVGYEIADVVVS
jgi:uncharacterized protein DUF6174